jgi:alkylation response protein AidB-like acyl-CoA dehydrogenase
MEFGFNEQQQAIAEMAESVFRDHGDDDRIARIYESDDRFDGDLWQSLAQTGLLGAMVPEDDGGSGLGMLEFGIILELQGATLGVVPYWRHSLAALAIASFGTAALKARHLPALIDGSAFASIWTEAGDDPAIVALPLGNGWKLDGIAHTASLDRRTNLLIVPAKMPGGEIRLFVVPTDDPAIVPTWGTTTTYESVADLEFNSVEMSGDALLSCNEPSEWLETRCSLAISGLQVGVVSEALKRASSYVSERRQFGRTIGSFQAVAMRMAEAYIQLELLRTAQWQLCWRLDQGLPAATAAHVAKFQASEAGHIIGHTAQHYHGGTGADVTYPVHRFLLWSTALDIAGGGAQSHLEALGASLPDHVGFEQCVTH